MQLIYILNNIQYFFMLFGNIINKIKQSFTLKINKIKLNKIE